MIDLECNSSRGCFLMTELQYFPAYGVQYLAVIKKDKCDVTKYVWSKPAKIWVNCEKFNWVVRDMDELEVIADEYEGKLKQQANALGC